jgi:pimeloyl-ACP methyl ester carboxylesterase
MASPLPASEPGHLVWKRTTVDGRTALYGVAGEPDATPLLFLHGWGLGQHSYKRALKRLVGMGTRVYAPALPGFGGTHDLPANHFSFDGYADWIDQFLTTLKVTEPAFVVGHSFGGGVGIQLAHDFSERVRTLVLINSVGGSAWAAKNGKSLAERPLWDWGIHFPGDILLPRQLAKVLPVVLEDAVPNLVRNPLAFWKVANLARTADLRDELEELKARKLPVVVLWGDKDRIIPRDSFDDLCQAIGQAGEVVDGNHSWLLADPDAFGEVMTNVLSVARLAKSLEQDAAGSALAKAPEAAAAKAKRRPQAQPLP